MPRQRPVISSVSSHRSIRLPAMKHVRTFLLVAMGLVGLAVSGPVTMEGTAQIQQHNLERGQILDKRAPDPPHHHIPGPPHEYEPLPEPHDFDLCMDACKSSHKHTDKACTAWCNKCIAQGRSDCD